MALFENQTTVGGGKKMRPKAKGFRLIAAFMTALMFVIAGPYQAAVAAMIPTEGVTAAAADADKARQTIKNFLARQDVQSNLSAKGINPEEAKARVASLTDTEALMVSKHIENMPAGGDTVGIVVVTLLVVFIALLITDLLGLTHVFPFVKKHI
jgi:hypothetical protein